MKMESQQEELLLLLLCEVCEHNHKYEVCGVCGHSPTTTTTTTTINETENSLRAALSELVWGDSEIVSDFLYLGSYTDYYNYVLGWPDLLQVRGITHFLSTVPGWKYGQNVRHFTCHSLQEKKVLQFDDAIHFLDQCEEKQARVLVHCMTGNSRSAAIVIAYLMKFKGWRLEQSYQWVKERRPSVDLSSDVNQQLQDYEQKIFCSGNYDADLVTKPPRRDAILSSPLTMAPMSFINDDLREYFRISAVEQNFVTDLQVPPERSQGG